MRTHATLWLSLLVCLPVSAFGQGAASPPDGLAKQVLAGLTAKDDKALHALALDQAEFKKYVWPRLNGVSAGKSPTLDKTYSDFSKTNDIGLQKLLDQFGGQQLELVRVTTGAEQKHKGYRLLTNPEAVVKTSTGQE